MPVKKLKSGKFRYGKTGKVYKKRSDAERQGRAIKRSQKKK